MADTDEAPEETPCSLCPTDRFGELVDTEHFSTLLCGHQVHTECLIKDIYISRLPHRIQCNTCLRTLITPEMRDLYHRLDGDEDRVRQTPAQLWETNEEFRRDIRAFKKSLSEYTSIYRKFNAEVKPLVRTFKENIALPLEAIKEQKIAQTAAFKRIPLRKQMMSKSLILGRYRNRIRAAYHIGLWELTELRTVPGAPKFSRTSSSFYRWRMTPRQLFRVRM